jgi:ABC-type transporter Mla maintaining outer membrane lipid asymmetry ATPase subunit MlaF
MSLPSNAPVLEFSEVFLHHPSFGGPLLEDLSFAIRPGEVLALTGPAGSGKTSALALAIAADGPTAGEVLFNGTGTAALDRDGIAHLRTRIGWVPQQGALVSNLSLLDNLALPLRWHRRLSDAEARPAMAAACELVDLELDDLPQLQPARAGQEMRQLIALATALVLEPALLVVDEPGAGLGGNAAREYWRLLHRLRERRGLAVLVAATDAPSARAQVERCLALPARHQDLSRLRPTVG